MVSTRKAQTNEADMLTNIAIKSESYWGDDKDYIDSFKIIYKVTGEFINNNPTFILEEDNNVIGFYSILNKGNKSSLEYFYIEPRVIGKGYGKIMWKYMLENCRKLNINKLEVVTSPQVKGFYIKMGAIYTGEVESLVRKGRIIPKFIYTFK